MTSLGIVAYNSRDLFQAETFFIGALTIDKNYFPAIINLAQLYKEMGEHKKSVAYFKRAHSSGREVELTAFLTALSEIQAQKKEGQFNLAAIHSKLNKVIQRRSYLYQEAKLLKAYLLSLKADRRIYKEVEGLLDIDPQLVNEFRYNLFIYRSWLSWKKLEPYCNAISKVLGESGISTTLMALCKAKMGDLFSANNLATKAISQAPENPLVMANISFIKKQANLDVEANTFLRKAVKFNQSGNYKLPSLLQSRHCFHQKNEDCAVSEALKVLRFDSRNYSALNILARVHLFRGDYQKSKSYAYRVLKYTNDYIPLIEVTDSYEAQRN